MGYKDKKIAVVGVSNREEKYGFRIFKDLISAGYQVYGINPRNGEVLGRKIYKTLSDIEDLPDVVITVVPHQITEKIVDECHNLGIKEIWMQPGSESDLTIAKAKDLGIVVIHNSCFMVHKGIW